MSERDKAQTQEGKMLNNASEPDTDLILWTVIAQGGGHSLQMNIWLCGLSCMLSPALCLLKKKDTKFYSHPPSFLFFLSISLWPG